MLTMRRVTKATELKRFKELEGEYHYMGETHSGGDTMRLVFEEDGKWVALMVWGSACYHLKPRDAYVGWANSIRAERLKLVVNNRRFTILSEPGERRNLDSECLGLVARELSRLWLKMFRYRPLLAETFCDIERTGGTCYKAAGWIPLGQTQGFTRVNRQDCDFYVPNGRPKAVWVKPLCKDALHCQQDTAREILCSGGEHMMQVKGNQPGVIRRANAVVRARKCAGDTKKTRKGTRSARSPADADLASRRSRASRVLRSADACPHATPVRVHRRPEERPEVEGRGSLPRHVHPDRRRARRRVFRRRGAQAVGH